MSDKIIEKLAEAFVLMKADGRNLEETIHSALNRAEATPGVREEVLWFAAEMEEVLKKHDHKGGWGTSHELELLSKLLGEVSELIETLRRGGPEDVIHECVDVANYAMMIADNARE